MLSAVGVILGVMSRKPVKNRDPGGQEPPVPFSLPTGAGGEGFQTFQGTGTMPQVSPQQIQPENPNELVMVSVRMPRAALAELERRSVEYEKLYFGQKLSLSGMIRGITVQWLVDRGWKMPGT